MDRRSLSDLTTSRFQTTNFHSALPTSSDAALYHIDVSAAAVQNAITAKNMRYAFSLPKPCYYKYKDRSISKVSDTQITTPYDQVVGDLYAMEMELHYTVTAVSSSALTGSSDAGKRYTDTINFNGKQIKFSLAADPGANDDADCDTTSAGSFLALMDLFGLQRYIWFPFLNGSLQAGNMGYFVDGCEKDNVRSRIQSNMKVAKAGLDNIKILEAYIRQTAPNRPEEISRLLAAVNTAAESLRTATSLPARPQKGGRPDFEIVQQEIQKAKIYFTSEDLTVPRSEQKRTRQTESARPRFTLSKKYFMYSAAGSGDCHAGQTGVNTIP